MNVQNNKPKEFQNVKLNVGKYHTTANAEIRNFKACQISNSGIDYNLIDTFPC